MWEPTIPDWGKVKKEHVKFIFEQAEKRVDEIIKTCDNLSSRIYTLLTLHSAIWVAICGYVFSNLYKDTVEQKIITVSLVSLVVILVIMIFLFSRVYPNGYYTSGSQPKDLFNQKFFDCEDEDDTTISLYYSELCNYQDRISHNNGLNKKRADCIRAVIITDCVLPIALFLLFISL